MVHRTYGGLGDRMAAVRPFEGLTPWASQLLDLQWAYERFDADDLAFGVALDGLETAAFHFTRGRAFYDELRSGRGPLIRGRGLVPPRADAVAGLIALGAYYEALGRLQMRCRPFGAGYNALGIAMQGLDTAAHHFTGDGRFYGARGDGAGPMRPPRG